MRKSMSKKVSRILSACLVVLLIAAIPFNCFAASKTIKCDKSNTYTFSGDKILAGTVQIKKGGVTKSDYVNLWISGLDTQGLTDKYTVTMKTTYSNGKTKTFTATKEYNNAKQSFKLTENGKVTMTSTGTYAMLFYAKQYSIDQSGYLWKALTGVNITIKAYKCGNLVDSVTIKT